MTHRDREEEERRRHHQMRAASAPGKRADTLKSADNDHGHDDGDNGHEWDPHADHEIHSLRAGTVKFTLSDGHDPDAVVDLRMGPDLGIYASTRSTRRRVDAVAPGRAGLLAAYSTSGTIAPIEWMHTEVDDETGQVVALRVARDVAVRDVVIENRGSVGSAIDALREAAILADRHRLTLEHSVERLTSALAESEARFSELARLVESIQYVRVEHESKETADAWSFRTYKRSDGTDVFAIMSADGVSRSAFCARPARRNAIENAAAVAANDTAHFAHTTTASSTPDGGSNEKPTVADEQENKKDDDAPVVQERAITDTVNREEREPEIVPADGHAADNATVPDNPAAEAPAVPTDNEPASESGKVPMPLQEPVVAAIPVPTTGGAAPLQQRRTKSGRKARPTATALESPGSPPAARGVKTRQSARRASSHSASLGQAESLGAVTMARPVDDADTA
nr:hypothetical protein [Pandoravirus aubagnensis]